MYTVSRGKLIDEDDVNDETKIPKAATDLRYPLIPLEARQASLEKISRCLAFIRDLERRLVLQTTDPEDFQKARERLSLIKTKTTIKKLVVRCEFKTCAKGQPEIPVYHNLCGTCQKITSLDSPDTLISDLLAVSNLTTRLLFLQERMSMSLSNLLNEDELRETYTEINSLADCF